MDRIATQSVVLEGGVIQNLPTIDQGMNNPGSLQVGQNLEPDYNGGYSTLTGYTKSDTDTVDGAGSPVDGVFISSDAFCAVSGRDFYTSTGSGWTKRNSTQLNASPGTYIGSNYYFGATETLIFVNGKDYPQQWDGTSFTILNSIALTGATAATYVTSHKYHMFYCRDQLVTFSKPGDPSTVSGGGGQINVGHEVTALVSYRDSLYCLGPGAISKITGSTSQDFSLEAVSTSIGIIAPRTLHEVNGDIVFLAKDGLRSIAATEKLDDINLENLSRNIEKGIRDAEPTEESKDVCAVVLNSKNQYRIFISDSTLSRGAQPGFLGALRKQSKGGIAWEWFTTLGFEANCANYGSMNGLETVVHGDYDGYVHTQEIGRSFDGDNIAVTMKFPYWSFNDPEIRKTLHKLRSYISATGSVNPTYQMTLDYLDTVRPQPTALNGATATGTFAQYGTATYGNSVYSGGLTYVTEFYLVGTCFNAALTISSSDTNVPYTVQTLNIQYGIGGRK